MQQRQNLKLQGNKDIITLRRWKSQTKLFTVEWDF